MILRGDVWLADLDPRRGAEADKHRPVVIVSNDGANAAASRLDHGVVTVVPVSSSTGRVLRFQVSLSPAESGLSRESKAQAEQVRSIDVVRLSTRLGRLSPSAAWELDESLRLHLAL
ncbi:type II toxin-antitoxin system PemK/MazF family toxin [Luteipulveratus sp. YIM 133132]|uniref:type II toxin-antitoxin system PemK/MazF family toxin n=1 Tax=Luteipulveratus flavus TaxID=3031728 RepID=UPI0023AE6CCC|nr:type II toxin-antitoxin system PemK/MazF family toxin [Luteipulveratus sp. YIM 133132]MDE9365059.1 type II toxin-antitoxin system PemK/MazF family toxin [Luteipulveratus sp. YIM 133132]